MALRRRLIVIAILALFFTGNDLTAAERFYISIPGPTLSYVPLYYGQEKGFFTQEGLDLQVLVVRGIVGVSSLMVRFLRAWNRGLKAYQESPEIMIAYIQKRLGIKDAQLARRMYDDDAPFVLNGGG